MVEIADIFRRHGPEYLRKYQHRMPPVQLKVFRDILQCRTRNLGGHLFFCPNCRKEHYSYHSCKNRHCPKCQCEENQAWLDRQKDLMLPVKYFMVTFTIPAQLRPLARSHQKLIYNILFAASAAALQKLAADPRFIGGRIGMLGVLQTWTRQMNFHPHIHFLIPAGAISYENGQWIEPPVKDFLVPVRALSTIFRAKFRDALAQSSTFAKLPARIWKDDWIVHAQAVGDGEAALTYLARYLKAIAISNHRICRLHQGRVTFSYTEAKSRRKMKMTVTAEEFIRRFLQHVLPHRFVKVRYYGFLAPNNRRQFRKIQQAMGQIHQRSFKPKQTTHDTGRETSRNCPKCHKPMIWIREIPRQSRHPP